jgi:hypothetical protein
VNLWNVVWNGCKILHVGKSFMLFESFWRKMSIRASAVMTEQEAWPSLQSLATSSWRVTLLLEIHLQFKPPKRLTFCTISIVSQLHSADILG